VKDPVEKGPEGAVFRASAAAGSGPRSVESQPDLKLDHLLRRDVRELRPLDRKRIRVLLELRQEPPEERQFLLAPQALVLCPPPFKRTTEVQVTRVCSLPGGQAVKVVYTAVRDDAGMVFGRDAVCLDVLAAEARRRRVPEIGWGTALALMRSLHIESSGGRQYRLLEDTLRRIGGLHIAVTRPGLPGGTNIRVVDVDGLDAPWRSGNTAEPRMRRRRWAHAMRLSPEFFGDVMDWTVRVPRSIVQVFANSPFRYHMTKWLLWRISYAQSPTEITWAQLRAERGSGYGRLRAFRAEIELALKELGRAWPPARDAFGISRNALRIRPVHELLLPDRPGRDDRA
jgi:hypothetical protein